MNSYRHAFHAGNFADVFKHVLLRQIVRALHRKEKPFRVFDTHAGAGRYDLRAAPAAKNREYRQGIARLWGRSDLGPELRDYLASVHALNPDGRLRWYPGSPRLVRDLLRSHDRLTLTERHPADYAALRAEFAGDRHVTVHHADGYTHLRGGLPPPERRGLVFIDPAFELRDEFKRLTETIQFLRRRWATAKAAIWYPILDREPSRRFQQRLQQLEIPALLCVELGLHPYDRPFGLHGCGMIVINPPWQLEERLRQWVPELATLLSVGPTCQTRVEWLTPAP